METIRNYLETMFANMPNTPEVKRAKDELLQMMEDKYNELIAEGVNENAAVGTVISEFGNLDELAESLGLEKEVDEVNNRQENVNRRFVSMDEVKAYLSHMTKSAIFVSVGVMLCIISVIFPIIGDISSVVSEGLSVGLMFLSIAIAVGLFVFNGIISGEWTYLRREPCQIDMATAEYVKDRLRSFRPISAILLSVGVLLCAFCWVPFTATQNEYMTVLLFLMVGFGVLLIIYSSMTSKGMVRILGLNDKTTISGTYSDGAKVEYTSKTAEVIMSVYWPTITCIYLCVSFITFAWYITWIIWPIAAVLHKIFSTAWAKEV